MHELEVGDDDKRRTPRLPPSLHPRRPFRCLARRHTCPRGDERLTLPLTFDDSVSALAAGKAEVGCGRLGCHFKDFCTRPLYAPPSMYPGTLPRQVWASFTGQWACEGSGAPKCRRHGDCNSISAVMEPIGPPPPAWQPRPPATRVQTRPRGLGIVLASLSSLATPPPPTTENTPPPNPVFLTSG
ncbi:hypothetical protein E2C01_004135 [Portunus trituberculatus]|uniref:Uncharacterized protein n=1 Tax=Portunus trituberculatus TaxID=210409 RepID=A0A5B7CQS4_PORTR|nr:hypothetical protein [Portunus trituberculatus]